MTYLLKTQYGQSVIIKSITNDDGSISQTIIPVDPENTEYQQYLDWIAEGNTPE